MLHGALPPRVYLAVSPAGAQLGYPHHHHQHHQHRYADELLMLQQRSPPPPAPFTSFAQLEDAYAARLEEQRLLAWEAQQQQLQRQRQHRHQQQQLAPVESSSCPLDLSVKPSSTSTSTLSSTSSSMQMSDECEAIEVDDEEDRRGREEARNLLRQRLRAHDVDVADVDMDDFEDDDSQRSCSSASLLGYPPSSSALGGALLCSPLSSPSSHPHQTMHNFTLQQQQQQLSTAYHHLLRTPPPHQPMTPPSTPSPPQCQYKRANGSGKAEQSSGKDQQQKPTSTTSTPRAKKKHARRLKFDEDTSSPVSGTVILRPDEAVVTGDIDPAFNIVEVTEEARAELAKIDNKLGPYQCKLCRHLHDDAFQLAQHRCSRIAHVEYRCPECDKRFSCPANLASHRRWHKPRAATAAAGPTTDQQQQLACSRCDAKFAKQSALRKHVNAAHPDHHHHELLQESKSEQNNNNVKKNNNSSSSDVEQGRGVTADCESVAKDESSA